MPIDHDTTSSAEEANALPLLAVDRSKVPPEPKGTDWRRTLSQLARRIKFLPFILVAIIFGGIVGLYFQPPGLQFAMRILGLQPGAGTSSPIAVPVDQNTSSTPAQAPAATTVIGLGALIPEGEVSTIAPPFGAGDARIAMLLVSEGQHVEQGATLAILDNEAPYKAAVQAARANLALQTATLAQTRLSVQASQEESRATLASAKAAAHNAEQNFQRAKELLKRNNISQAVLDQRRSSRDQTVQKVEQARANLSRFASIDLDQQVDVIVAKRQVEASQAALHQATEDLEKAYVRAPRAGTILSIHTQPGEKPSAKGILNLANINRMTVEIEIYQTKIHLIQLGDPVEVSANALPHKLIGEIYQIGLEVKRQTLIDDDPAATTDSRIVKVTALLNPASSRIAAQYTNLQVIATVRVGGQSNTNPTAHTEAHP